ncbi:hypothetical protein DITRI_Ditri20bG0117300 [Diplodiscus trichospermus]
MKGGRKNLKRAAKDQTLTFQHGQSIMQVLSLRGSNIIEMNIWAFGGCLIVFQGSFVVVDESGKERALESGSKVACIVSQVLFYEQVHALQKSPEWPEIFKSLNMDDSIENEGGGSSESLQRHTSQQEVKDEFESSDDDGLPPLEANMNRIKPFELQSDRESYSGSDTD